MAEDWTGRAGRTLLELRAASGWGYRSGSAPCVEPSVLAALSLLAMRGESDDNDHVAAARGVAEWLVSVQQTDGSLGVSAGLSAPGWGTAYGLLLWGALEGYTTARRRADQWLLRQKGETMPREKESGPYPGHDPSLVGWPWVNGTHSWVEPTALAILALRREGFGEHARVQEGLRVLRDRAIVTGGWNCGNKAVFGHILRPQPAPTGLALLALAHAGPRSEIIERSIGYLVEVLPGIRAAESLSWGLLGLRAWGQTPVEAGGWLAESYARVARRPDAGPRLALLLLAAGDHALELFDAK